MRIADVVHNSFGIDATVPHFGIEIEVERAFSPDDLHDTMWSAVSDGSLRDSGIEFLSRQPFTKQQVTEQVPIFYRWFEQHRFTSGVRTSTHVHVNVLDMTSQQVAAACTVHALVEPILFRYCGPLREENIYCVPWYRAPDEVRHVREMQRRVSRVSNACKYTSLFIEPVTRFGTLEFRHAPVFATAGELLMWIDMCERIVYSGFENPEQVMEAWRELSVEEFVEGLFGEQIARVLRGYCETDFEELLDKYDTESVAEQSCCTYNENASASMWFATYNTGEGAGTDGYHSHIPMRMAQPMFEPEYDEYPEDEYHDEEEW